MKHLSSFSFSMSISLMAVIIMVILTLVILVKTERQLDDCRFEVNHLQTKLWRLEELNDYIPAMEQVLPPLVLAQLKVTTEIIRQKKYREYERIEQPLISEKERRDYE